jgi:hypothetical protein
MRRPESTARNSRISITTAPAAGSPRGSTKEPAMFDLTYFRVESSRPWVCSTVSPNCQYLRIVNY